MKLKMRRNKTNQQEDQIVKLTIEIVSLKTKIDQLETKTNENNNTILQQNWDVTKSNESLEFQNIENKQNINEFDILSFEEDGDEDNGENNGEDNREGGGEGNWEGNEEGNGEDDEENIFENEYNIQNFSDFYSNVTEEELPDNIQDLEFVLDLIDEQQSNVLSIACMVKVDFYLYCISSLSL